MSPQRTAHALALIVLLLLGMMSPAHAELVSISNLQFRNNDPQWTPRGELTSRIEVNVLGRRDSIESRGVTNQRATVQGTSFIIDIGTFNLTLDGPIVQLPSIMIDPEPMDFVLADDGGARSGVNLGDISQISAGTGGLPGFILLSATGLSEPVFVGSQEFRLENLRLELTSPPVGTQRTYTLRVNAVPSGAVIPEPSSWALLTTGTLGGLGLLRRRSRQ